MAYKFKERDYHLTESGWSTSDVPTGSRVESWRLSVYQKILMVKGTAIVEPHLA